MISFSNINKQYGKQLLFVDASFQLNPEGLNMRIDDRRLTFPIEAHLIASVDTFRSITPDHL